MEPDELDVIYISDPRAGEDTVVWESCYGLFNGAHEEVCIGWSCGCSHCGAFDLEVLFAIKLEVVKGKD